MSLQTTPEGERARDLFERLDTPVGSEDLSLALARTHAADKGEQLLLPNLLRLRAAAAGRPFLVAYRADLRGFALAWLVVAAMLGIARSSLYRKIDGFGMSYIA